MELKVAQSLSLETAVKTGEEWSMAEVDYLKNLRAQDVAYYAIAQLMGRSVYSVTTMARVMGIAKTRKTAQAPKIVACTNCNLVHSYECE